MCHLNLSICALFQPHRLAEMVINGRIPFNIYYGCVIFQGGENIVNNEQSDEGIVKTKYAVVDVSYHMLFAVKSTADCREKFLHPVVRI